MSQELLYFMYQNTALLFPITITKKMDHRPINKRGNQDHKKNSKSISYTKVLLIT